MKKSHDEVTLSSMPTQRVKNGTYYASMKVNGKTKNFSLFTNKESCAVEFERVLKKINKEKVKPAPQKILAHINSILSEYDEKFEPYDMSLNQSDCSSDIALIDFATDFLEKLAIEEGSKKSYRGHINFIRENNLNDEMRNYSQPLIQEMCDLKRRGTAQKTTENFKKFLSQVFGHAYDRELIRRNPVYSIQIQASKKIPSYPFTQKHIESIINASEGDWLGMVYCGMCTGLRIGDASRLQKSDFIDIDGETVLVIKPEKKKVNADPINLPITEPFLSYMKDRDGVIFPSLYGKNVDGNGGLSYKFGRILRKAGIIEKGAKGKQSYRYHSFRNYLASVLINAGWSLDQVKNILGHESVKTSMVYVQMNMLENKKAMESLRKINSTHTRNEK